MSLIHSLYYNLRGVTKSPFLLPHNLAAPPAPPNAAKPASAF